MLTAGCAANKATQSPNPTGAATAQPDEIIGKEVRYRIETQCPGDAAAIRIVVNDGMVTLQGVASSQAVAWRVQAAAAAVPGVKAIRNELLIRR